MAEEDDLLKFFEKFNIRIGNVNPLVIKAWFDTDCKDLLQWMCSSLTEENYVSPQEELEYMQLENPLTKEELEEKCADIDAEYPGLFDYEQNLVDIDIARDTVEILERELQELRHQRQINEGLNQNLTQEFAKLSSEEIQCSFGQEAAQEKCVKACQELNEINDELCNQISRYSYYFHNFGVEEYPQYINNINVTELEEKFSLVASYTNNLIKLDGYLEDPNAVCFNELLSDLEKRLFQSQMGCVNLQMKIEGLNCVLKFLDGYNVNTQLPFLDKNIIQTDIEARKNEQIYLLKMIEVSVHERVKQQANEPMLKYLQNESQFCQIKLNDLHKIKTSLSKVLTHFVVMHSLSTQEKMDINNSKTVFSNVAQYVNNGLRKSGVEYEAMLKLIEEYENYKCSPVENKLRIVPSFSSLLRSNKLQMASMLKDFCSMESELKSLEKQYFSCALDWKMNTDLYKLYFKIAHEHSNKMIEKFLVCGPTSQYIVIPQKLQKFLEQVDDNLLTQKMSIKQTMNNAQIPKATYAKDKWLKYRNQLWILFITKPTKLLALFQDLRNNTVKL